MIRARLIGSPNISHYLVIERMRDGSFFDWKTGTFSRYMEAQDLGLFASYLKYPEYKFFETQPLCVEAGDFTNVDLSFLIVAHWGWPFPKKVIQTASAYVKEPQYGIRSPNLTITLSFPKVKK